MYAGMSTPDQDKFLTACKEGDNNTVRSLVASNKGVLIAKNKVSYHIVGCVILYFIWSDLFVYCIDIHRMVWQVSYGQAGRDMPAL